MTNDRETAPPAQPWTQQSGMGRRRFLRGAAAGAGVVGVATMLPSILTKNAVASPAGIAANIPTAAAAHEPFLIFVRDALRGEAVIMRADGESVIVDHVLVAHLLRADGGDQA